MRDSGRRFRLEVRDAIPLKKRTGSCRRLNMPEKSQYTLKFVAAHRADLGDRRTSMRDDRSEDTLLVDVGLSIAISGMSMFSWCTGRQSRSLALRTLVSAMSSGKRERGTHTSVTQHFAPGK